MLVMDKFADTHFMYVMGDLSRLLADDLQQMVLIEREWMIKACHADKDLDTIIKGLLLALPIPECSILLPV